MEVKKKRNLFRRGPARDADPPRKSWRGGGACKIAHPLTRQGLDQTKPVVLRVGGEQEPDRCDRDRRTAVSRPIANSLWKGAARKRLGKNRE